MAGIDDQATEKRQKRGKRVLLLVMGLMLVAGLVCNYWPMEGHITISRETTYVTGPLNPDGTINYVAALNERLSKGVTRENNAAVLLVRAIGADCLEGEVGERQLALLGIKPPVGEQERFVSLGEYLADLEGPTTGPGTQSATRPTDVIDLLKLLEKLGKTPWSAAQYPRVDAWLRANEKPLALACEATTRPRHYLPLVSPHSPPTVMSLSYPATRYGVEFAFTLAVRAMRKLHAGDVQGAWSDIHATYRLARLTGQGWSLIEAILSMLIEETAWEACAALARSATLDRRQARAFQGDLDALAAVTDLRTLLGEGERFMLLDSTMALYRAQLHGDQSMMELPMGTAAVYWDDILRGGNRLWDLSLEEHCAPDPAVRARAEKGLVTLAQEYNGGERHGRFARFLGRYGGHLGRRVRTRRVARLVILFCPNLRSMPARYSKRAMRLEVVKVSLALAAFRAEKGVYPQKLSELSPAYVKKVPADVFAERPLVYKRDGKGYLLHSVGPNMTDDGGKEFGSGGEDDIVVRVK